MKCALVVGILAAAPAAALPGPPRAEQLKADTPQVTSSGATYTAPATWTLRRPGNAHILEGPEPDLRLALVEVSAADADAAVAAAWPVLHPGFKRPIKLAETQPARNGWEEYRYVGYEISPDEKRVEFAVARRKGTVWTVVLVHANDGAFQRRVSQVNLIVVSLRPKGYARESFKGRKAHALDADRLARLTAFIEKGRELLGIPGVALTLLQDGQVVFAGGFGVRELGKAARVDADTTFMIASTTKALTTLLLARLVEQGKLGKLGWETPVIDVYPAFKLGDAETTRQVRIKHLVCACTGMPRQDMEWFFEFGRVTPDSLLSMLGAAHPTTKLGEVFQYSNMLGAAAGYVGAYALDPGRPLGTGYDAAMRSLVFAPLGMTQTTFDFARALRGNHAGGHAEDIDGRMTQALVDVNHGAVPIRPTGGAWSSVREVGRYVQMELARGKLPDGGRLLSEENLLVRSTPQIATGEDRSYGMGLGIDNHYGIPMVGHDGALVGYRSLMSWLPDHGVGVVVLVNASTGGMLAYNFNRKLLEVLFDGKEEADENLASAAKNHKAWLAKERERLQVPADAAVVAALARRYTSAALGEIVVRRRGSQTVFDFGEWRSPVASRKNDDGTTSLVTIAPGVDGTTFVVATRDGKRRLIVRDAQHEYEFSEAR